MAVRDLGASTRLLSAAIAAMAVAVILMIPAISGCTPSMPRGFDSPEPAARNSAIVAAARSGDRSARAELVRMLDSDDATTRLLAITTLQEMEGVTLGYDPTASEPERDRAIDAWKARLAGEANGVPASTGAQH